MAHVGRALQLFGLILLPAALLYGLTSNDKSAVGRELVAVAVGGLAFVLGNRMTRAKS